MNSLNPHINADTSSAKSTPHDRLRRIAVGYQEQGYCWVRAVQLASMSANINQPSHRHDNCGTCTKKITTYVSSLLASMAHASDVEIAKDLDCWLDVVAGHESRHLRRYARLRHHAPGFRTRPNKDGRYESNHHRVDIGLLERHFAWFGGTDTACRHCGARFVDTANGRPALHCSKACKQAAYRERKRSQRYETKHESG